MGVEFEPVGADGALVGRAGSDLAERPGRSNTLKARRCGVLIANYANHSALSFASYLASYLAPRDISLSFILIQ